MNKEKFIEELVLYRKRSVPLVVIEGALDAFVTFSAIRSVVETGWLFRWDTVNGLLPMTTNQQAQAAYGEVKQEFGYLTSPLTSLNAGRALLQKSERTGERLSFVFFMGDRVLSRSNPEYIAVTQLLCNLRDEFKTRGSAVYLVGVNFDLPAELTDNVVVIREPLPSIEERRKIVDDCVENYLVQARKAKEKDPELAIKEFTEEERVTLSEDLSGSSLFAAETALYLALSLDGIDREKVVARKMQTINGTNGLKVHRGEGTGFQALGGLDSLTRYCRALFEGRLKTRLVVRLEEVEKVLAGSGTNGSDSSGVSQSFLGEMLTFMNDTSSLGMLFTGVYGAGKSRVALAIGEEAEALTVEMNLSAMKGSLVGESEGNLRRALSVLRNVSAEQPILFLATCNRIEQLPPEFRRRFNLGTFFFDFPSYEERIAIWNIYRKKYQIEDAVTFDDDKWTGAEIENCCRQAYLLNCSLADAAKFVVPVHRTASAEINQLQTQAVGRYLSASYDGPYQRQAVQSRSGGRNVSL
jgi:hypothetical protein